MTTETNDEPPAGFAETQQSVRGLRTIEQANTLHDLTLRGLKKVGDDADHRLSVMERANGTFDLLVFRRIN